MLTKIIAVTHDQQLKLASIPIIASGAVNTNQLTVDFDEMWELGEDITYYANFFRVTPETGVSAELECSDGTYNCLIPSSMLTAADKVFVAVYAKNTAGNIVKTSTVCKVRVLPGAFPGALPIINWQEFKSELILAINNKFGTELAEDSENSEIIETVSAVASGVEVTENLFEMYNAKIEELNDVLTNYGYNALPLITSESAAQSIIESNSMIIKKIIGFYLECIDITTQMTLKVFSEATMIGEPDYDITTDLGRVEGWIDGIKSQYLIYRGLVIDTFGGDYDITTDSSDDNIAEVFVQATTSLIVAAESKKNTINSMYTLYTGGNDDG